MADVDGNRLRDDRLHHPARKFGAGNQDIDSAMLEHLRMEPGYVDDLGALQRYRLADMTVKHIGDLVNCELPTLLGAPETGRTESEAP